MPVPAPIRVLLADDQPLLRAGFRVILEAEPDIEVVGEAADGLQAVDRAPALRPDVVLMDIRMPRLDGLEATAPARRPAPDGPATGAHADHLRPRRVRRARRCAPARAASC